MYHTAKQVFVGAALGSMLALIHRSVVVQGIYRRWLYPRMFQHPGHLFYKLARYFYLVDTSAVKHLLRQEYEWALAFHRKKAK